MECDNCWEQVDELKDFEGERWCVPCVEEAMLERSIEAAEMEEAFKALAILGAE